MAVETLKSTMITNLDLAIPARGTSGENAAGDLLSVGDFVTVSAAASVGSKYLLARIPSNAKVKNVIVENEAQAVGAADVGLYYSDATQDGTQKALQGTAIAAAFFASALSLAAAIDRVDHTNESGTYSLAKRNQPIWQAAGLSSDPGGFFDVVATVTTAVTTGTGRLGVQVNYQM